MRQCVRLCAHVGVLQVVVHGIIYMDCQRRQKFQKSVVVLCGFFVCLFVFCYLFFFVCFCCCFCVVVVLCCCFVVF